MPDFNVSEMEARLEKIERSLGRYRRAALLLVMTLLGSSLVSGQFLFDRGLPPLRAGAVEPEPALVVRDSITIVDASGRERILLAATVDGASAVLFDAEGRPRANITAGYATAVTLYDEETRARAVLGATTMAPSHVQTSDGIFERRPVSSLVLFRDNGAILERLP